MIFKSQVYTDVSGSVGGITYAHNKGGMYARARRTPTNPNSPRQQAVRAVLGGILSAWTNVLTAAQRTAWDTYAANTPTENRLGEELFLSGQQFFIRSNVGRVAAGLARVDDGPTTYDTGTPMNPSTGVAFLIASDIYSSVMPFASVVTDSGTVLLFIGKPQPSSRSYFRGPYQFAGAKDWTGAAFSVTWDLDTTDPDDWHADYVPVDGDRVPIRVVNAHDDGRYSQAVEIIQVCTVT